MIPARRLVELVEFAERHDLWVISDECYDEINFDGDFVSTMAAAPSPRVVSIYSFSESPDPNEQALGWAAALVLVFFVLLLNISAKWFAGRKRRQLQGG